MQRSCTWLLGTRFLRFALGVATLTLGVATLISAFPVTLAWAESTPVMVTLAPRQSVVGKRGAVGILATFKARQTITLCLLPNPLSQFTLTVTEIGRGLRPLPPSLVPLPDPTRYSPFRKEGIYARLVPLKPGQVFTLPLQVPRVPFSDGVPWESAEYKIGGSFALCDQTPFSGVAATTADASSPQSSYAGSAVMGSRASLWEYPGNTRSIPITSPARFYLSLEK